MSLIAAILISASISTSWAVTPHHPAAKTVAAKPAQSPPTVSSWQTVPTGLPPKVQANAPAAGVSPAAAAPVATQPGVAAAPATAQTPTDQVPQTDQGAIDSIQQAKDQYNQAIGVLNTNNPMADPNAAPTAGGGALPEGLAKQLETAQKILQNPVIQAYMRLLSDPEILKKMQTIIQHPKAPMFLWVQLGVVIGIIVLRIWRMAQSKTWYERLFTSIWTFIVGILVLTIVSPTLVFGETYLNLLKDLYKALFP